MKKITLLVVLLVPATLLNAASILIPMDETQTNHLKAYGVAWHVLDHKTNVQWLLNYRGGSYLLPYSKEDEEYCLMRNVKFETLTDGMAKSVLDEVEKGTNNTAAVMMQRAPSIAVYAPAVDGAWDDAVVNVLNYSEIPYQVIYDAEVLNGDLLRYDWLHLHHEDFTGQYGRFWLGFHSAQWYKDDVAANEATAKNLGFMKVSQLKLAVAKRIQGFVANGGFMFAMCSATDSYDIALAAEGIDICDSMYDGDAQDNGMNAKLNYEACFAFTDFRLKLNSTEYEFSNIDTYGFRMQKGITERTDYFYLNTFSVLTQKAQVMLVQNHTDKVKGFWGATTGFNALYIKPGVDILASTPAANEARYIHGSFGEGMWTFYGGHDPEDYQHRVEEPAPDLDKYPNSPGYRLIMNNILFQSTRMANEVHVSFAAYPVPAATTLNVNYTLPETQSGTVNIYDATGKKVISGNLQPGVGTTAFNVSELSDGNYVWQVESNGTVLHSDKFAVAH